MRFDLVFKSVNERSEDTYIGCAFFQFQVQFKFIQLLKGRQISLSDTESASC